MKPRSIIILQPSEADVRIFQASKFDPLIRANPALERVFVKPRSSEGVNNQMVKDFRGGHLMFSWSGSTGTLKGRSAPFCLNDEVDEYEHSPQGHPADLLAERSATFGDSRLNVELSTPTDAGVSRIESRYQLGDQRRWLMRCVECESYQVPDWTAVEWKEENPLDTACWVCQRCGYPHANYERIEASRQGKWVASAPFVNHASFHISGLASPLRRLGDMCVQYQDLISTGKPLNTFQNAVLGEPHVTASESARDLDLTENQIDYEYPVPEGVRGLVAAVDVQKDRLEAGVWGWDKQSRSWCIGTWRLEGAPTERRVWEDLWKLLSRGWERRGDKKQHILVCGIDAGFLTMQVEEFIAAHRRKASRIGCRLYALKGVTSRDTNIVKRPTSRYRVGRLAYSDRININAIPSKVAAMRLLHSPEPEAPGYCTFPLHVDDEFFDSLTSEEQVVEYDRRGFPQVSWRKIRERNEIFDIFRYSHAMAMIAGIFDDDGDKIMNIQGRNGGLQGFSLSPPSILLPNAKWLQGVVEKIYHEDVCVSLLRTLKGAMKRRFRLPVLCWGLCSKMFCLYGLQTVVDGDRGLPRVSFVLQTFYGRLRQNVFSLYLTLKFSVCVREIVFCLSTKGFVLYLLQTFYGRFRQTSFYLYWTGEHYPRVQYYIH